MATLDIIMTGFTGSDEIREMTERSIRSLRESEGSENFNIIFLKLIVLYIRNCFIKT